MKRGFAGLAVILMAPLGGCGDDDARDPDTGPRPDACAECADGGPPPEPDAGVPDGGAPDAGSALPGDPIVIALSPGHDRVYAVVHDADGNLYATGQIADDISATADYEVFVAKITPAGTLDTTFGTEGITRVDLTPGGGNREAARGIVVQSSGRIVIGATTEHDPSAAGLLAGDTDIALVGFTPDGDLDATFGSGGIERIDPGTGTVITNAMGMDVLSGADQQWGLAVDSVDRLVLHVATRSPDGRSDTDYALLRRLEDGGADDTFGGGDGIVTLDIGMANAGQRSVIVLPGDALVAAGYTTSSVLMRPPGDTAATSQQPVIWQVTASGEPDATFAATDATLLPGVWHDFATPLPERRNAEAYGFARQTDGSLVTIGYGPTPVEGGMGTDLVSFRFTSAGVLDPTYGTGGSTYVDIGMLGDNGRHIVVLPDDRTLSVGAGRPMPAAGAMSEQDALVLILEADGAPDAEFAAGGFRTYDLGGNDHFWGADVFESAAGDRVAIGGIAAGEVADTDDDDSAFLFLPL